MVLRNVVASAISVTDECNAPFGLAVVPDV